MTVITTRITEISAEDLTYYADKDGKPKEGEPRYMLRFDQERRVEVRGDSVGAVNGKLFSVHFPDLPEPLWPDHWPHKVLISSGKHQGKVGYWREVIYK